MIMILYDTYGFLLNNIDFLSYNYDSIWIMAFYFLIVSYDLP